MPLALYAVGAVPVSLRAFVPEAVLDLGLLALAIGVGWLAAWFFARAATIPLLTVTPFALASAAVARDQLASSLAHPSVPCRRDTMSTPSRPLVAAAAAAAIVATAILAAASGSVASAAAKTNAGPAACRGIEHLAVPGAERLEHACLADLTTTGTLATGHTDSNEFTGFGGLSVPEASSRRRSQASSSTATSRTSPPSTPPMGGTTTPSS